MKRVKHSDKILTANRVGSDTIRYAVAHYADKEIERVVIVDVKTQYDNGGARPIGAVREDAVALASRIGSATPTRRLVSAAFDDGTDADQREWLASLSAQAY